MLPVCLKGTAIILTHPSVPPEEPVGERVSEVVLGDGDHLDLALHDVLLRVRVVAHVHEVVQQRRDSLVDLKWRDETESCQQCLSDMEITTSTRCVNF